MSTYSRKHTHTHPIDGPTIELIQLRFTTYSFHTMLSVCLCRYARARNGKRVNKSEIWCKYYNNNNIHDVFVCCVDEQYTHLSSECGVYVHKGRQRLRKQTSRTTKENAKKRRTHGHTAWVDLHTHSQMNKIREEDGRKCVGATDGEREKWNKTICKRIHLLAAGVSVYVCVCAFFSCTRTQASRHQTELSRTASQHYMYATRCGDTMV